MRENRVKNKPYLTMEDLKGLSIVKIAELEDEAVGRIPPSFKDEVFKYRLKKLEIAKEKRKKYYQKLREEGIDYTVQEIEEYGLNELMGNYDLD